MPAFTLRSDFNGRGPAFLLKMTCCGNCKLIQRRNLASDGLIHGRGRRGDTSWCHDRHACGHIFDLRDTVIGEGAFLGRRMSRPIYCICALTRLVLPRHTLISMTANARDTAWALGFVNGLEEGRSPLAASSIDALMAEGRMGAMIVEDHPEESPLETDLDHDMT